MADKQLNHAGFEVWDVTNGYHRANYECVKSSREECITWIQNQTNKKLFTIVEIIQGGKE